jgi:hypothetical protein
VDTDIVVESSIIGSGISDTGRVSVSPRPVSVGENTFETNVTFSHLLEADAGAYSCSAYIASPPSLPNVITSDSTSGSEPISIGRKCPTAGMRSVEFYLHVFSILQLSKLLLSLSPPSKEYPLKLAAGIPLPALLLLMSTL